jgi:hypothetical protein
MIRAFRLDGEGILVEGDGDALPIHAGDFNP